MKKLLNSKMNDQRIFVSEYDIDRYYPKEEIIKAVIENMKKSNKEDCIN